MSQPRSSRRHGYLIALLSSFVAAATVAGGLGSGTATAAVRGAVVNAVGAENEYADVISQIGGRYVHVSAIMSNPNTDPHSFEASPAVARTVAAAQLVVQNGVGYDDFMNKIESASPNGGRKVIDVQNLRGLPDKTPNPHLWYSPQTMPLVAEALANDLALLQPTHAAYFQANATRFINSLTPWFQALARFAATHPNTPVATSEPVANYMLAAAGTDNLTPLSLQEAVMNGTDPAPQDISQQASFLSGHEVKVFLYNEQVTDSLTETWLKAAHKAGIPVVGVYETMPTPGYDYQTWMQAEVRALTRAVAGKTSTAKL